MMAVKSTIIGLGLLVSAVSPTLFTNESSGAIFLGNDRLVSAVDKSTGAIDYLALDNQDLLGSKNYIPNTPGGSSGNGKSGIGPYLDCYCIPSGTYTPGGVNATYTRYEGVDSSGTSWGGIVMSEVYPPTGQLFESYWFLRDGETGLHTFSRLAYYNETTPFLRNLQELRTLFRPNTPLWTHLITDDTFYAPLPLPDPAAGDSTNATTVQDATWYIGNRTNDPYVQQMSDFFTKYTFQAVWRDHDVHGMFADGRYSEGNLTYGAWVVMNTKDTYFGGPIHSDLVVDGIVYNYIVSNHHGDGTPNITDGFDRTFGPYYFHFNSGPVGGDWMPLYEEALTFASPAWNADFYDDISGYVPGYVPTSGRGSWEAQIQLPEGAENAIAVLAQNNVDFQDNVEDVKAYQYWSDISDESGQVQIDRVKAGTYRLTIYADGIFGDYVQDDITIVAGEATDSGSVIWEAESAGKEIWRIGRPDKSGGEWKHGYERNTTAPLQPPEYRIYFGAYDYIDDFPDGVNFHVGSSVESEDFNYVHWSVFGGYANFRRPVQEAGHGEINNWTITFDVTQADLHDTSEATFTVQLAGAKTAAGNTDVWNATQPYSDLPFVVAVNGQQLDPWIIPYYHSSSCAVRSAVVCYQVANKFTFPTSYLKSGSNATNEIILSLPFNATDYESAVLPESVYVQYDALRLEVK
ncbi:polysaccharide lyase family 4 protein [Xylariaceae sp. FL1019]|nr:polysaccharide lyase family 4 protein [Xylariaceae sp. FL1019]